MSTRPYKRRAAGLLAGYLADRVLGDPRRLHPVAGFGCTAAALEKLTYRPTRVAGAAHVCVLVGAVAFAGRLLPRHTVVVAAATWTVLCGRSLEREALAVHDLLARGDLDGARVRVRNLVGRDTSGLDAGQVARAAVESVAENGSDAVVAPLFWGAVAGTPGLLTHRAINTLDAMIGHHTPRYEQFGWAAAKLRPGQLAGGADERAVHHAGAPQPRPGDCGHGAPRRARPPQPERRPGGVGVRCRPRGATRRHEQLSRGGRAPRGARRRTGRRAR